MSAVRDVIPAMVDWSRLANGERSAVLTRPGASESEGLLRQVQTIIRQVRRDGDRAVRELTLRHDGVELESLQVSAAEFDRARESLTTADLAALERAIGNVRRFHDAQAPAALRVEISPGVICERIVRPIDAVGLYVPAGTAPLPSTAIMLAVPAAIAGCATRVMCTPPRADGSADPAVLTVAQLCEVSRVFKIGGAQAVAAMAFGTESVPKVDKIYGPGSAWVTAAKLAVANDPQGAALDLPAGPSEVLVIADETANPSFVAADLLAQAEHSVDAQVVLVSPSVALIDAVLAELERQVPERSRHELLLRSLAHSRFIRVPDLESAFEVSNAYAPEHLILQVRNPRRWLDRVRSAGSIFLGPWTPETIGDYCSGTNHVLPTYGFARAYSGLSLVDFTRRITVQELSAYGLKDLGPTAMRIASLEGLDAHAQAVAVRLDAMPAGDDS